MAWDFCLNGFEGLRRGELGHLMFRDVHYFEEHRKDDFGVWRLRHLLRPLLLRGPAFFMYHLI